VIEVINKQRLISIRRQTVARLAQATLDEIAGLEGHPYADAQLSVVFVRDQKIQELNRLYRGKDFATDVLSFQTTAEQNNTNDFAHENYLGDIVISTDTARRQARDANLSIEREIQELVMHGVLHLCGYDHENDRGEMNRLELKLRKKLLK
jgi:probable rRNA maturation factor